MTLTQGPWDAFSDCASHPSRPKGTKNSNLKLEKVWKRASDFMFLLSIISLNAYPISRAAGAMYQSARGNAIVKVN